MLIHVEVQNERDHTFDERMFIYNIRSFDRYRQSVISIAVLADDSPSWRPKGFGYGAWGLGVAFKFLLIKLRDYNRRWQYLEQNPNPFALVVMAHLKTRASWRYPQARLRWKMHLVRLLYQRGFERQAIVDLFRFIDWVLELPKDLSRQFRTDFE